MIQTARRFTAFCTFFLFALGMGSTPLVQAQTYVCKQADGSEIMTNTPTGGTCKLFKPGGGTISQAPDRAKTKERQTQELAETRRRATEDAQRRATEAQNRRVQELLEAQRQAAVDMRRRAAEADAQRQAAAAQEAQRLAAAAQQQAAVQKQAAVQEQAAAAAKISLIMFVMAVGVALIKRRTFLPSVYTCLIPKYADFEGRARRSEFWWFEFFQILVDFGIGAAASAMALSATAGNGLSLLFFLAILLPGTAVAARRLHDVNRSGWWQLIALTIVGIIPLLYWFCSAGDEQSNDYGFPV